MTEEPEFYFEEDEDLDPETEELVLNTFLQALFEGRAKMYIEFVGGPEDGMKGTMTEKGLVALIKACQQFPLPDNDTDIDT